MEDNSVENLLVIMFLIFIFLKLLEIFLYLNQYNYFLIIIIMDKKEIKYTQCYWQANGNLVYQKLDIPYDANRHQNYVEFNVNPAGPTETYRGTLTNNAFHNLGPILTFSVMYRVF